MVFLKLFPNSCIRLKQKIGDLIEPSQSAFLPGLYILDSVAFAQEIISACTKCKWPDNFLKLDFLKAFDTINWSFILKILQAQGFGNRWWERIHSLLNSGFSSVLINGSQVLPSNVSEGYDRGIPFPLTFLFLEWTCCHAP